MADGSWITSGESLRALSGDWDALATAASRPYAGARWGIAWWQHLADERCRLRTIAVREGDRLVGIAPFYARERLGVAEYRLLGSTLAPRIEPLALPGRERDVAAAITRVLAGAELPAARLHFEGIPADSPWPGLLADTWPVRGRSVFHRKPLVSAPTISLPAGTSYEEWMAAKSRRFRHHLRRSRRQLDVLGAKFETATSAGEVATGIDALARLFAARHPGKPAFLTPALQAMLISAAGEAGQAPWFRLETVTIEDDVISAHLFLSAGGETAHWNGGFDERYAAYSPSVVSILAAVEHGFAFGERRIDLGQGMHPYKVRMADVMEPLQWVTIAPPGPRQRRTVAVMAPDRVRSAVTSRLTERQKAGIRALAGRATSVVAAPGRATD